MLGPSLLVLDEPFSALDATLGDHLRALLLELKAEGTALILASHGLPSVQILCDQILLLRDGKVLCRGPVGPFLSDPLHPHLRELIEAVPVLG